MFAAAEYVSSLVGHSEESDRSEQTKINKSWPEVLGPKEIEKYRSPDSLFASYKRNRKTKGVGATEDDDGGYRIKYKRRENVTRVWDDKAIDDKADKPSQQRIEHRSVSSDALEESMEQTIMRESSDDWVIKK